ncbi:hypothetical protein CYMTET_21612 [Cymbomonas tetramitiformis]|uniref:Uncharacterized protein n=1 Tax=Cymbomonas tetramitiformis TaxID=36881 RepID=A0AAE0G215_9CHLO|nr:hypothetical protein CYMTET_21612 [Cymbomonas tetramitiformis]
MQWTTSMGADRRLGDTRVLGVRLMDDCALLVAGDCRGADDRLQALRTVFAGYVRDCYPDGITVEQTSDGLSWIFCGMQLTVSQRGAVARLITKNVQAGIGTGDQLAFFPTSDAQRAAAVIDVLRELKWQGYPRGWAGWLFEALVKMVARAPFGFWNRLRKALDRAGVRP